MWHKDRKKVLKSRVIVWFLNKGDLQESMLRIRRLKRIVFSLHFFFLENIEKVFHVTVLNILE